MSENNTETYDEEGLDGVDASLLPVPMGTDAYAAWLVKPNRGSAILALVLAIPMYFIAPYLFAAMDAPAKLPPTWRFASSWLAWFLILRFWIGRPM